MKQEGKLFSKNSRLAMYLALRAARKGARRVYIPNDVLKLRIEKDKVHKTRIDHFAVMLKPFFLRHEVVTVEHYRQKNGLYLYFTERDFQYFTKQGHIKSNTDEHTWEVNFRLDQPTIDKALPIQLERSDT